MPSLFARRQPLSGPGVSVPEAGQSSAGWPRPAGLVTSADGSAKQLYHGTRALFDEFRRSTTGEFGPGVYLTDHPGEAAEYGVGQRERQPGEGVRIMPVFAAIRKPFTEGPDAFWSRFGGDDGDDAAVARAQAAGFDGIVYQRPLRVYDEQLHAVRDTGEQVTHYVVFDPQQVRSVFTVGERPQAQETALHSRAPGFYFDAQDSELYKSASLEFRVGGFDHVFWLVDGVKGAKRRSEPLTPAPSRYACRRGRCGMLAHWP